MGHVTEDSLDTAWHLALNACLPYHQDHIEGIDYHHGNIFIEGKPKLELPCLGGWTYADQLNLGEDRNA